MNYPNKIQSDPSLASLFLMFLCQTTIPSGREFRTRKRGGDGTSCDAGAKSQGATALRANPNPPQAALAAVAPRAPEAAGNKLNNRAIIRCAKS